MSLQYIWSLFEVSGVEIKCRTDRDGRHIESISKLISPHFLTRASETDKGDHGSRISNLTDDLLAFIKRDCPEFRRLKSRNPQPSKSLGEVIDQPFNHRKAAPIEKHRQALRCRSLTNLERQRWAIDPVRQLRPVQEVESPTNRLTIWNHKVEVIQTVSVLRIKNSGHHAVNGERGSSAFFTGHRRSNDTRYRGLVINCIDRDSEKVFLSVINHSCLPPDPPAEVLLKNLVQNRFEFILLAPFRVVTRELAVVTDPPHMIADSVGVGILPNQLFTR